jgi:hypothetical protein
MPKAVCPKCGYENPITVKFCGNCGNRLRGAPVGDLSGKYVTSLELSLISTGIYLLIAEFTLNLGWMGLFYLVGGVLALISAWMVKKAGNLAWIATPISLGLAVVLMAIIYIIPVYIFPIIALYAYYKALPKLRGKG